MFYGYVFNYPYFYEYPFGYPWIFMDIHALTCYRFSIHGNLPAGENLGLTRE